jgi:rod shape-determining protein MreC
MIRLILQIWENFKEYIILVLLLIFSLFLISYNNKPAVKQVRAIAFASFASITSILSDMINIGGIKSENERLRLQNAELMLQVNRLREYGIVNSELKGLVGIKDTATIPLIPGNVVSRSLSRSQGVLTINVGDKSGVKPGMPVINDQGLVGVVHSTSDDYSIIRTLKNMDLKLTVKDERSRVDGIMKWTGSELVIIDVPKTYDVEPGDRIIASDISSVISLPLPIGIVIGLSKVKTGIFNEVTVKPFVNPAAVDYVFVIGLIKSKQKNDLELNFYNR